MVEAVQAINMIEMGKKARQASYKLASLSTARKNYALLAIADALEARTDEILAANQLDLKAAEENGVDPIWIRDRIALEKRMAGIITDVRKVAELSDPVGEAFDQSELENGLKIFKRRVPLGVLGTIYESRPNVTVDIATLALKTGNAVILRGGSDVLNSNLALVKILKDALEESRLPADAVQYIESTDRKYVGEMLKMHDYIDMIIPRGGSKLHDFCRENSTIPVIIGGMGVCHMYVDESADLDAALPVLHNAKTQRPAVCNSIETLLVNQAIADDFLPRAIDHLREADVVFQAEPRALKILEGKDGISPATDDDFYQEWYALKLNVKVVDDLDEAIDHIREHSTQHSEGILTQNMENAERFLNEVDSSAVFLNASTRFNDGSALGLGAEVAISTQKLHARGPMALQELTTYKWIIVGDNTIRE